MGGIHTTQPLQRYFGANVILTHPTLRRPLLIAVLDRLFLYTIANPHTDAPGITLTTILLKECVRLSHLLYEGLIVSPYTVRGVIRYAMAHWKRGEAVRFIEHVATSFPSEATPHD